MELVKGHVGTSGNVVFKALFFLIHQILPAALGPGV
jgi:hypothetical protein